LVVYQELALKIGIVFQDFVVAGTSAEEFKDIRCANSHTTDARATNALAVVD
jgi:hypothetical protein